MKTLLNVSEDERGEIQVSCPDKHAAVVALHDHITKTAMKGDQRALDVLFAVTVHFLAQDLTGKMEEKYIENLRETTLKYRQGYADYVKKMREKN